MLLKSFLTVTEDSLPKVWIDWTILKGLNNEKSQPWRALGRTERSYRKALIKKTNNYLILQYLLYITQTCRQNKTKYLSFKIQIL